MTQIRGDLQSHTTDSDGRDSLEDMAHAAESLGYEYLAVTDHTPAVRVTGGLDAEGFVRQWRQIDRLNARLRHLRLLRGVECDIHKDGTLDLDEKTLAGFDVVLASVHSFFELPRGAQTKRLLAAIRHPAVHIIAHPTARIIGRRQPIELDAQVIVDAAAQHGVALEINAQPERMDLDHEFAHLAIAHGVRLSIGTDAHSALELNFMRWGVDQARRSWGTRADILNTRSLSQLLRGLAK
jgi:DNA polymerase (family 10)